jgi:radical SAM superfamily enzyme YgiQ (UPF0313 family)
LFVSFIAQNRLKPMQVVLISTYELGHQPFGLASPTAWLREAGAQVTCLDLDVQSLAEAETAVAAAGLVAFYVPMHTATRLAAPLVEPIKALNPQAHLCFYGLYAPVNEAYLRQLGADTILGGEFEAGLVALYRRLVESERSGEQLPWHNQPEPRISLAKQVFQPPDRQQLPGLEAYAQLDPGDGTRRLVGYTEASRGCKHLCRHCPIVPVYNGRFRIIQHDVVLADIRQQVAAGAQHITFGDPDFFNGPGHAIPLIQALHAEFPQLTYDVIIKVEHLLRHADLLPVLGETGCLFVTSAVEAVDDLILEILDKGHTRADFIGATTLLRDLGLTFNPTFVAFNPWISLEGYLDLLGLIAELELIDQVAPVQYAIRLLIPAGSRLLDLQPVRELVGPFDEAALVYPWSHPDPQVDALQGQIFRFVQSRAAQSMTRQAIFAEVQRLAEAAYLAATGRPSPIDIPNYNPSLLLAPRLTEPWYC